MHQLFFHEISWIWNWVNSKSTKIRTLCHASTLFSRNLVNQELDQHFQSREVVIATSEQGILMIPFRRQGPLPPETNHTLRPRRKNNFFINPLNFFVMKKVHLSLVLDANQYYAGNEEICRRFVDSTSDEYLNSLVASLAQANDAFADVMHIAEVRVTIKQENRQLMDRFMSIVSYLDSCKYSRTLRQRPVPLRSSRCSTPTASRFPV